MSRHTSMNLKVVGHIQPFDLSMLQWDHGGCIAVNVIYDHRLRQGTIVQIPQYSLRPNRPLVTKLFNLMENLRLLTRPTTYQLDFPIGRMQMELGIASIAPIFQYTTESMDICGIQLEMRLRQRTILISI